jgi:LPXTG-motif cell wall-anchored protein
MRRLLATALAVLLVLLVGAPAHAAETFIVTCHVCDKFDVVGKGLEPDATYTLVVRDVRTGQQVHPNPTQVETDASGAFSKSYPLDLAAHPSLQGTLYSKNGNDLLVAAHNRFVAPIKCGRKVALPYTGPTSWTPQLALLGALLVSAGGALLLATRAKGRAGSGRA